MKKPKKQPRQRVRDQVDFPIGKMIVLGETWIADPEVMKESLAMIDFFIQVIKRHQDAARERPDCEQTAPKTQPHSPPSHEPSAPTPPAHDEVVPQPCLEF